MKIQCNFENLAICLESDESEARDSQIGFGPLRAGSYAEPEYVNYRFNTTS